MLRKVADRGVGLLFVSHHLEESLAIGDDISVLRDGRLIWTRRRQAVDEDTLTSAMFGAIVEQRWLHSQPPARDEPGATPLLALRSLRWRGFQRSVDLDLKAGEIVGVAGLPGSGANSLNSAILGTTERRGDVFVGGRTVSRSVGDAFRSGVGYIPAERKTQAIFADLSMLDNLCAANLKRFSRSGVLKGREMSTSGRQLVKDLGVVPADPNVLIRQLSGGNQQKVIVGRWLGAQVRVMLADEPTRGVDIAARLQIHLLLERFASHGGACLVYSNDLDELVDISGTILLFRRDLPPRRIDATLQASQLYELMSGV